MVGAVHNVDAADGGTSFASTVASPMPNRPDRSSANRASNRSAAPLTHFTHMGEREQRSHHRRHRHLRVSVVVNKRLFVAMASEGGGNKGTRSLGRAGGLGRGRRRHSESFRVTENDFTKEGTFPMSTVSHSAHKNITGIVRSFG